MSLQLENIQALNTNYYENLASLDAVEKISWLRIHSQLVRNRGDLYILDLRSPKEFAMGSIPGAVNVPLLDDLERHDVGLLYKQEGKTSAVALGVELFATKADRFFDKLFLSAQSLLARPWGRRSKVLGVRVAMKSDIGKCHGKHK